MKPSAHRLAAPWILAACLLLPGCEAQIERPPAPENTGIYGFANGCFTMDATEPGSSNTRWLRADETGDGYAFTGQAESAGSRFTMRPSDLGTYLFYDQDRRYLVAEDGLLRRHAELSSDVTLIDDSYVSPAEWELQVSASDARRFQLRHLRTGQYLTREGLTAEPSRAAVVAFYPAEGCAAFPELSVDAEGAVTAPPFDDGSVFGIADTHSHIMSNFGFGGGGIFHGAAFHRLGVEHALSDCARFHGEEGRRDLMGYGYEAGADVSEEMLLATFIGGRTPDFNHFTAGYPDFTDWPAAPFSSTHQTQYYRWIERAYMAGLRLIVQHATTNSVMCELIAGNGVQRVRYSCNDMVAVDRSIEETYNLERYIDAQAGGPGLGFFRVVTSPEQARAVINEGRLAVILGIETSNLFDCFLTPPAGSPTCDEAFVTAQLDRYYELGVRAIFPVHKYDNGFSAGDGQRAIIEIGNFINSGHYSSFTEDCDLSVPTVFDRGAVQFGGLNMPRAAYDSPPDVDMSGFGDDPIAGLTPHFAALTSGPLEGEWCQSHGMTALGEHLMRGMMSRGMIIEIDHFPRRAYARAFELLEAADYPAAGTHGTNFDGRIYALGGVSKTGLGRCHDPGRPGATLDRLRSRVELITAMGGYPAEGFGFDLNGFAGAPGPRFGDNSRCSTPQENPVTYPFDSYAGDVTFTEPRVGNRTIDFNTEGFAHLGMLPELLEDARLDGATDEDLEPLFRSAEAYLRMWERAEARAATMP